MTVKRDDRYQMRNGEVFITHLYALAPPVVSIGTQNSNVQYMTRKQLLLILFLFFRCFPRAAETHEPNGNTNKRSITEHEHIQGELLHLHRKYSKRNKS